MAIKINSSVAVIAALSLAAVSFAQQPGRGQGGGQGGMRMMGGQGGGSEAMLLGRADVQKDLKLTPDQTTKLEALRTEMMEKMRASFGGGRRGGDGGQTPPPTPAPEGGAGIRTRENFNPEAMRAQMETMMKEANEKVKSVLTLEQWTRLGQIKVQLAGPRIVIDDQEVGKKIGVKASQKLEINKVLESLQQANMQIFAKMREPGADREAMGAELAKNDQILREEIKKILNADQMKALTDLEGPKFTADPNIRQGGFGGRGGGG